MLYGKLPIILLSTLAANQNDSTNCQIATYILANLEQVKDCSIRELARKCFVSVSSVSRFCRDIGLADYSELRRLLHDTEYQFQLCSESPKPTNRTEAYIQHVQHSISQVSNSIDTAKLQRLADDLARYQRVAIFGLLKAETVAMNLQSDLLMLGKVTTTKVEFQQQIQYLEQADAEDLIVIFSYTGIYFTYQYQRGRLPAAIRRPKIYFITGDPGIRADGYINEVIYFESLQDQASHPYQLQLIGGLIAQHYAYGKQSAADA